MGYGAVEAVLEAKRGGVREWEVWNVQCLTPLCSLIGLTAPHLQQDLADKGTKN